MSKRMANFSMDETAIFYKELNAICKPALS